MGGSPTISPGSRRPKNHHNRAPASDGGESRRNSMGASDGGGSRRNSMGVSDGGGSCRSIGLGNPGASTRGFDPEYFLLGGFDATKKATYQETNVKPTNATRPISFKSSERERTYTMQMADLLLGTNKPPGTGETATDISGTSQKPKESKTTSGSQG